MIDFLSSQSKSSIDDLINELKGEVEYIIQLLKEVINILAGLEITIKEQFIELVINSINATLQTMVDNYDGWNNDLNNSAKKAQTQNEIRNLYTQIQVSARLSIAYGYSHYDSVAMSFVCEFTLAKMLDKDPLILNYALETYLNFLKLAVNNAVSGSLASAQAVYIGTMQSLEKQYIAQIIILRHTENRYYYVDKILDIYGDIKNGFTFMELNKSGVSPYQPSPGTHPIEPTIYFTNPLNLNDGEDTRSAYNEAHIKYMTYSNNTAILNSAINSCNNYIIVLISYEKENNISFD